MSVINVMIDFEIYGLFVNKKWKLKENENKIRYFLSKCSESARRGVYDVYTHRLEFIGTATPRNHTSFIEWMFAGFCEISVCVRVCGR